jgi:RNA-directed DNA polymerase
MLVTPEDIRTLQRKLYTKAKLEPAYRFYALYDKVYRADILLHAWRLVRANQGSPGVDGMSFAAIERASGVDKFLAELAQVGSTRFQRGRPGKRRMPRCEEHRKAVFGKTACTV